MNNCSTNHNDCGYALIIEKIKSELIDLTKKVEENGVKYTHTMTDLHKYLKSNLSETLIRQIDGMKLSGELDELIAQVIEAEKDGVVKFNVCNTDDVQRKMSIFENVKTNVVRDNKYNTTYIVTKINSKLKPELNFTNGTDTQPYENKKNVVDYMQTANKMVGINAGLRGVTVKNSISLIEQNTTSNEGWYILGITAGGNFRYYPASYTATQIIQDGCNDACNIWSPLIVKGQAFDPTVINQSDPNYDYIITQKQPRQAIGRLEDGTYIIVTTDGRLPGESGLTFAELQDVMLKLNCVEAYNLDGGGSTQTVIDKTLISRNISKSRTIGTVITFNYDGWCC